MRTRRIVIYTGRYRRLRRPRVILRRYFAELTVFGYWIGAAW